MTTGPEMVRSFFNRITKEQQMNDLLTFLNSHGSARGFTNKAISTDDEMTIITIAERAPTSSNLHAYSIIGVRDSDSKKELAMLSGGQEHVADCSLFLVFCADMHRLGKLCEKRKYNFNGDSTESFIIATIDASLAAARALMAAQAMGMGGVMVGGIRNNPKEVCELLNLPELVYPVMGMSLGYPKTKPKLKPRLPINGLYFRERYDSKSIPPAITEYDETISKLGYLRGREIEPELYENFVGEYTWSEHTARRMASESPGAARLHLLPFLQERGLLKR